MDAKQKTELANRLEKIRLRNKGLLTPDDVVKDARSETSPLHRFFTWDDSIAATQYRLDQARTLIRSVQVEITTSTQRIAAPYYVRDPRVASDEQGYTAVADIRDEAAVAADALRYEFDRAIGCFERAISIAEALGIGETIAELIARTRSLADHLPRAQPMAKATAKRGA